MIGKWATACTVAIVALTGCTSTEQQANTQKERDTVSTRLSGAVRRVDEAVSLAPATPSIAVPLPSSTDVDDDVPIYSSADPGVVPPKVPDELLASQLRHSGDRTQPRSQPPIDLVHVHPLPSCVAVERTEPLN